MPDPLFDPLTPPSGAAATVVARCSHPKQFRESREFRDGDAVITYQRCGRCHRTLDPAKQRAGRRNRARGGRAELQVARAAGGSKVGPLGHPWDVTIPGLMRIQVRKYAEPQSLRRIQSELAAIEAAPGPEAAVYIWLEAGSTREGLVVQRYRDWVAERGIDVEADR